MHCGTSASRCRAPTEPGPVSSRGRAGRRQLRTSTSGGPIRDVTNSMSTWFTARQHGGWHGRRGARRAGVCLHAVLKAALRCTAVLDRCRGQQPQAAPPLSPSPWLTAAAIAIVSSDTTAHASCFHEGLLRITLCSPNSCCWSLSSSGPTEGGHMSWNTTTSAACYSICRKELRGGRAVDENRERDRPAADRVQT